MYHPAACLSLFVTYERIKQLLTGEIQYPKKYRLPTSSRQPVANMAE